MLAEAHRHGHTIRFDVLYRAAAAAKVDIEEEIGAQEGYYIRKYLPPLNYQIPKEEDWRKYDVNPTALSITLSELLERGNSI